MLFNKNIIEKSLDFHLTFLLTHQNNLLNDPNIYNQFLLAPIYWKLHLMRHRARLFNLLYCSAYT